MEFNGSFEIEGVTPEEVWIALSDPVLIKQSLDGCQYILEVGDEEEVDFDAVRAGVDDEDPPTLPDAPPVAITERAFREGGRYATEVGVRVGSVNPTFEAIVQVTDREYPRMDATVAGSSSNSSVEMTTWMSVEETDDGTIVEWNATTEIFGRIAQLGQRVVNPVANQVVNRFFSNVEGRLADVGKDEGGIQDRLRSLL